MKLNIKGWIDLPPLKGFVDLLVDIEDDDDELSESISSPLSGKSEKSVPKKISSNIRAGEPLKRGEAVHIDPMDRAFKASAILACGDDSYKAYVDGFVEADATIGSEIELVKDGSVFPITDGSLIVGKCVYLSTTPGQVSAKCPVDEGTFQLKLGTARKSNELAINIGEPIFNSKV